MAKVIESLKDFAKLNVKVLKSDRYVLLACSGETGEGKSCFIDQLCSEVSKITGLPFDLNKQMVYMRSDLKELIDGENKLEEHSVINADELISMFFKRNWYDKDQIDGIELLNKCRDRHLLVSGCIPNFWDLDSGVYSIIRFWVHIPERGKAWVFEKTSNPFARDRWYQKENRKLFAKKKHPYNCPNFVCEIPFNDWSPERKEYYYSIRNIKRQNTEGQRENEIKYHSLVKQRNKAIRLLYDLWDKAPTTKEVALELDLSPRTVRKIKEGLW